MAPLQPAELEKWLASLGSLLPREALAALTEEVRRQRMDGELFDALVVSRQTPSLGDSVRPRHMATLRRCWNARCGQAAQLSAGARSSSAAPCFAPPPRAAAASRPAARAPEAPPAPAARAQSAPRVAAPASPTPRAAAASPAPAAATAARAAAPAPAAAAEAAADSPAAAAAAASNGARPKRPPQVPRLDLSAIHGGAGARGGAEELRSHQWLQPAKTGKPPPGAEAAGPEAKGFARASPEDQQRIAEFYGYRDDGFAATMHGLRTDQIRPRLFVGSMADAAYWPHLKRLGITHVVNCAVEAQKVPPPYESHGLAYHVLPLKDSPDEAQQQVRQRFRGLRRATRFIRDALRGRGNNVFVHCVQGLSRSAALICAYLMEYEDAMVDRALAEVRQKHKGCLTSQHWQACLAKFNTELLRGS